MRATIGSTLKKLQCSVDCRRWSLKIVETSGLINWFALFMKVVWLNRVVLLEEFGISFVLWEV